MKNIFVCLYLMLATTLAQAQNYYENLASYSINGTPANGVKIKTNLPFTDGSQMPTIMIEGFAYNSKASIGLVLNYYVYNNSFYLPSISSYGGFTPVVKLANEGGKVVILIANKEYYIRFTVRAFAKGLPAETAANFSGWTVVDEALLPTATSQIEVPYVNRFAGDVYLQGGVWDKDGKVGIGITTPQAGLHVAKIDTLGDGTRIAATLGNNYLDFTTFGANTSGRIRGGSEGYLVVESNPSGSNKNLYLNYQSTGNIILANGGGNVGIGTQSPQAKLAVNGDVFAKRIKVTQTGWPDYVFEPSFKLPALPQLESFIREHKHLPEIPSAAEVEKDGQDVGDMNKKLLQKVEELTLYIIDQHKQLSEQQATAKRQDEILAKLQEEIAKLKQQSH